MSSAEVVLGFLEEAEPWRLQSPQFPSKVGGKPAWLSQRGLPPQADLECEQCGQPMVFLLQVYAPISGQDRSFHRTLFLFCCKTPDCYSHERRCMKVFRSQLPRRNEFYPYDPPPDEEPQNVSGVDHNVLSVSGVKLCWVCGCPGNKACSRCHTVTYCGRHHQTVHWKHSHKKECLGAEGPAASALPFLFPESELVTEPEEEEEEDAEDEGGEQSSVQNSADAPSLADMLAEADMEEMALHETEDSRVFQRFKKRIASEPHQVIRYSRGGCPLWVSSSHVPSTEEIPPCTCGAKRTFEFQVMPQLLNTLGVDSTGASIDWGTVAVYTCSVSCDHGDQYCSEFIWKQDFSSDQTAQIN